MAWLGEWIGYVGLLALTLAWVPQSMDTIRVGRCDVNFTFLLLACIGSLSLMLYAIYLHDPIFSILNALTTIGALINIYYKLFPREGR